MRIIWSEFAEIQLDNIFNYYIITRLVMKQLQE